MKAVQIFLTVIVAATSANSDANGRIMGGEEAVPHSLPFMIRFFIDWHARMQMEACGGSLISTSRIVSAAHCFLHGDHRMVHSILGKLSKKIAKFSSISFAVIAGAHNYQIIEPTQQRRTLTSGWIVHPDYDDHIFPFPNDVAVVIVDVPFTLNAYVSLIAIPPQGYVERFEDVLGTFSGWGELEVHQVELIIKFKNKKVLADHWKGSIQVV